MPRKKKTETATLINVVLDRSGSMAAIKQATIEGYNAFLAEQAKLPGARFGLTQFDSQGIDHLYINTPVEQVRPLDEKTFVPRGGTPLYDAIGQSLAAVEAAKPAGKVIFVIITDGQENASREFSRDDIFNRIGELRRDGWEFVFLGADAETYQTAASLGINSSYRYNPNGLGVSTAFATLSASTSAYRSGHSNGMSLPNLPASPAQLPNQPTVHTPRRIRQVARR